MILTITPNPAVDISYNIDSLKINDVNRCDNIKKTAGGKGLNVSRVLKQLNRPLITTGFLGGKLGEFIKEELVRLDIENNFIMTNANTRNCIAILHDENKQTEILENTEKIDSKYENLFYEEFENMIKKIDFVVCSGSLPNGISEDFYTNILDISQKYNKKVIIDTSGNQLYKVLSNKSKPYMIKPNIDEILDLLKSQYLDFCNENDIKERNSINDNNIKSVLDREIFKDIEIVLVSKGKDGAYLKNKDFIYKIKIPKIEAVNPVGSGDSSVAGMVYALDENKEVLEAVKHSMTCGILNTMENKTGFINLENYENIYNDICIEKIF